MKVAMFPDYRGNNPYQRLLAEALGREGVTVDFPRGYRRGLNFRRHLAGRGYDLLHLHWPDFYLRGRGRVARWLYARKLRLDLRLVRLGGTRLVWTVHNLGRHDAGGDPAEAAFHRWLGGFAERLFVHDEPLVAKTAAALRVDASRIVAVPHGHYADFYGALPPRAEARALLGIEPEAKVFLFLGMLRPYKGLEELFAVWPSLVATHPEARLLVVGGGNDTEYIGRVRAFSEGLPGARLEARFVPDAEIPRFYGAADVAVFPFRAITTSGSLILAASYGCPIVTPRIPSTASLLGFLGPLIYPPGSPEGLREALEAAFEPPGGDWAAGFAALREHYSWERMARLTAAAYRAALGGDDED
jgi:beta-1,4-mannosyltransferase